VYVIKRSDQFYPARDIRLIPYWRGGQAGESVTYEIIPDSRFFTSSGIIRSQTFREKVNFKIITSILINCSKQDMASRTYCSKEENRLNFYIREEAYLTIRTHDFGHG